MRELSQWWENGYGDSVILSYQNRDVWLNSRRRVSDQCKCSVYQVIWLKYNVLTEVRINIFSDCQSPIKSLDTIFQDSKTALKCRKLCLGRSSFLLNCQCVQKVTFGVDYGTVALLELFSQLQRRLERISKKGGVEFGRQFCGLMLRLVLKMLTHW